MTKKGENKQFVVDICIFLPIPIGLLLELPAPRRMSHDAAPPDLASGRELGHRASSSQSSWASWSDSSSSLSETVSRLHGLLPTFLSAFDRSASQASAFLLRARVKDQEGATIDWAHENAKERARRTALSEVKGIRGIRARLWDSMTPWIVVVATGVTVGLLAASLDIVTAWLSDLRSGVCRDMYWAPKAICCTGLDRMSHQTALH